MNVLEYSDDSIVVATNTRASPQVLNKINNGAAV